jgi:hypothetical protein
MQNHVVDMLLTDLRHLIRNLGKDGGLIGPSVYDTAQVVRLAPPSSDVQPALEWLTAQQQPDGGWGDPSVPLARDLPTLAALLALNMYATRARDRAVVRAGLTFLRHHAICWAGPLPAALPVGVELLLPRLLHGAAAAGLIVPREPYAGLIALGKQRQRMTANMPTRAGTTPVHVWEAWGSTPDLSPIDAYSSVGHSPAATAAWLRAASGRADLAEARTAARQYLEQAAAVTGADIPYVVPTAWPIPRFEQSFALYALLIGGLLDHPNLRADLQPQIADLAHALRPSGIGFSDYFAADGDDTAVALAVLRAAGYSIDPSILERFAHQNHFCAYAGELQSSLSVTAHAAHTLTLCDASSTRSHAHMIERQLPDGRWCDDKWNSSWLYTTSQVLIALLGTPTQHHPAIKRAITAVLAYQHDDGGWGTPTHGSNSEETAYGVLMLRAMARHEMGDAVLTAALGRAERWMLANYRPFHCEQRSIWLAKENYRPQRIVRMIELAASFPSAELAVPLQMAQFVGGVREVVRAEQGVRRQDGGLAGM